MSMQKVLQSAQFKESVDTLMAALVPGFKEFGIDKEVGAGDRSYQTGNNVAAAKLQKQNAEVQV